MSIQETLLHILLKEPFYGHIASKFAIHKTKEVKTIQINIFPYLQLLYNPTWFEALSNDHKYGYIFHELLHVILQHPFRGKNKKLDLWAVACDIVVNQYIDSKYLNNFSVNIECIALELNIKLQYYQNAEYYYEILKNTNLNIKSSNLTGQALINISGSEKKSDIIKPQDLSLSQRTLLNKEVSESLAYTGEKIEALEAIYNEYIINWRYVLKKFLSARGKQNKKKSFKRVSRRFDSFPGNMYTNGVEALIALDESGSMSDDLVSIYIKELKEINKITGVKIHIVRFDSECSDPVLLTEYINKAERTKRGGTDFRPIFQLADKMKIPLVIIFTDGKGVAPENVNQKVLWLLTKDGVNPTNYGEMQIFTA